MKILMISKNGDGFGIAQRLQDEGHEIRIWVQESGFEFVLQGIIDQVSSWRPSASDWADLVISDMVGFGRFATALDQFEVNYVGFNQIGDLIELDRAKQMQLLRKFHIEIPVTEEFSNPNSARSILEDWIEPGYVIKPSGNLDTGKTFVVREPEIFDWALDQFSGDQELVVQRIISGVEVSTEGWFNGKGWIGPFNHTLEKKRFLNDDVGPNTGCMGNVVWAVERPEKDKLVKNLMKLTDFLKAADFKGPIDINTIVNADGIFALELTPRFGYDAIEALYELFDEKQLGEFLADLGKGSDTALPIGTEDFAVAIRVTLPPYPHRKADKRSRGMPIQMPQDLTHFNLADVYLNNGTLRWSASDGVVAKVTARGKTIKEAQSLAYKRVKRVKAQGLQDRTDIGDDAEADIKKLETWGYLPKKSIMERLVG